jgi:hypothetical protein
VTILLAGAQQTLFAQDSKLNTNLGMGVGTPLNPTASVIGAGVNVVVGAGYNFTKHNSFVGQFMWEGLPVHKEIFGPLLIVANRNDISGSSNLFTFTGNYRYGREGKRYGAYAITGGGLYYRRTQLSQNVVVGTGTTCSYSWLYWGYTCANGYVTEDQSLLKAGSTAGGVNGGIGFTIRINDDGYKFYIEARYHYAWTKNIPTTVIPITLGFSW